MRGLHTTLLAAAAAAVRQAAAMRPAAMHPTAAMRPPAPMQPIALATRRCILAAPLVTLPRRANALYDTKTVDAAKATYDVADATKCKAYLPLLDASGKTLDELAANWDRIATDGDSVRRYLGTVGVTSPLFKIRGGLRGVLKANDLPDAFDAVAFAEASEQFLAELQDAEGDAYGAQFADYSTSVGSGGQSPSATMLGKARKDVERAQRSYAELLKLLAPLR
ncbi:unnamed protein product [Pelagomonas calceolata]|uniref:Uncharacterized protein n=1 Tax=Pelagomonas calceolata TaxID=35677 RepID=A0A8J2WTA5_9STRA|nr:unnamed protein product [Pelagomonas calceolata]